MAFLYGSVALKIKWLETGKGHGLSLTRRMHRPERVTEQFHSTGSSAENPLASQGKDVGASLLSRCNESSRILAAILRTCAQAGSHNK
jgi:hypothetical protein